MRVIEFKKEESSKFIRYVDIGFCEMTFEILDNYLPLKNKLYHEWYLEFKNLEIGVRIVILNYLLHLYDEGEGEDCYGEKINNIIAENYSLFMDFNNAWFDKDLLLFNLLDLTNKVTEDEIKKVIENGVGRRKEVYFNDGSIIKFLDEDDTIDSFYVLETNYPNLVEEMAKITCKFKSD